MFLESKPSLDALSDIRKNIFYLFNRQIECFFQDVQKTLDESGLETLYIFILCTQNILYSNGRIIDKSDISALKEAIDSQYEHLLRAASYIFDCSCTLSCAEKQQKAFERQIQINERTPQLLLPEMKDDAFFEHLYEMKIQHGFNRPVRPKSEYINGYRDLYEKCSVQPIPALLLPFILTAYSVDGKGFKNLYPFFKYKQRDFTKGTQKRVVELFIGISDLTSKNICNFDACFVPIFQWSDIEKVFCEHHKLTEVEIQTVKEYFNMYRNHNDLSKKQENELLELPFGDDVRSLAKLCNLNTYIMMNLNLSHTGSAKNAVPNKAKRPQQRLYANQLLPMREVHKRENSNEKRFDDYFCGLYRTIPCNPDFSYLALLRYFRLPLDSRLSYEADFFPEMEELLVKTVTQYANEIRHRYQLDQQIIETLSDSTEESKWLNGRRNARINYKLRNVPEWRKYAEDAKTFGYQVLLAFSETDYREFISKPDNFCVHYFPAYLKRFCEKYSLHIYADVSAQEACFLEDEAFSTILDAVQNYLLKNVVTFWHNAIARELYG